jgi:hypothetical protein
MNIHFSLEINGTAHPAGYGELVKIKLAQQEALSMKLCSDSD